MQSAVATGFLVKTRLKARFIFNPHSGSNRRNPHLRDRAAEFIKQHGWDACVVATERPRHATELARRAVDEGCGLVVAIGGLMAKAALAALGQGDLAPTETIRTMKENAEWAKHPTK